jgi:hypothetical protein
MARETQGHEPYRCPYCGAELDMPPPPEWHEGPVEEEG